MSPHVPDGFRMGRCGGMLDGRWALGACVPRLVASCSNMRSVCASFLVLVLFACVIPAQTTTGTINGIVSGPSIAAIPGLRVTSIDEHTRFASGQLEGSRLHEADT